MLITVLLVSVIVSAGYAAVLERLHDIYSPDHIWVTVAIGNSFILASGAVCAALGIVAWSAVGVFALLNFAWGVPIVTWQLWQANKRRKERGL